MNNVLDIQRGGFADTVRKLRITRQFTQKDLACLAGVYQEDIDKIEHGIPLQLETRLKILRILYAKNNFSRDNRENNYVIF
jgi:transcriptional regulator with XRE-family HTH domain